MANVYEVKQVTLNELPQAADLFNQYRIFYEQQSDLEGAENFLRERIIKQESVIFLAKKDGSDTYVGFCQLYPSFSSISMKRTWILNDLFVHAEYRGHGIGRLLLEHAKQHAITSNSNGLGLSTAKDNKRAQHIYKEFGFEHDEVFEHYFLNV